MEKLWQEMRQWMAKYAKSFYTDDEEVQLGISLKEEHTGYVMRHCLDLARHLKLSEHDVYLAGIIGLFHDVGRFRQYTIYKTFNDARSEDHADLGLKVLTEEMPLMEKLTATDEATVRFAIQNHNKMLIGETADKKQLLMAKIIRDADKLDIYRVLAPYLRADMAEKAPKFIHTSASQEVSPDFAADFMAGKQADYHNIRTHGDRKIVRLMWVYDLNFAWTLEKVMEQGYVKMVMDSLPKTPEIEEGIKRMENYIAEKRKRLNGEADTINL